jgi:hypothetical protein
VFILRNNVPASTRVHGHARDCETRFDAVACTNFSGKYPPPPWATIDRNPVFRKHEMQSLVVKFRNLFAARVVLFTACALALAACETDATMPTAGDAPRAVTSARPHAEPPRTQAAPVANSQPMTHSRAARECWMRTEKGSAHENLDKRAELVNKCIDEKLKAAGVPSPRS